MKDYILLEIIKDACKAFALGSLLLGMWVCFTACTTARELGLDIEALNAEGVMPF